ncbi:MULTISPECIES: DUF3626 domain-containing protein [unclassified Micromonospora]|uniref:DUF3626 domain-containing protein n=1 Tax=unclassified Micromonospora TaxID=2617518 RepID=UPI001B371671|nr:MULTISPECIES: DUF3626 domain-containing protein [unclassified Micromonospora]MBQ1046778.1 DUF3626 domain-containing protein [Micromonospora sp. C72]MBQ1058714.1 DUF3626 domain-containing protein [Micromonospora sp. C32]
MILGPVPVATLTDAQSAALRHVRDVALRDRPAALAVIAGHLAASGATYRYEEVVAAITGYGRLTLNFHPDRVLRDGRTVVEALDAEGVYRSQFETGVSNGGLTAYPGGDRDVWEQAMFGGAYQRPGVLPAERPKYGGLNLLDHADGACPRFGSCHLRLRPEALARATFSFGDSHIEPTEFGTVDAFEPVFAALLTATAGTGVALGVAGLDTGALLRTLLSRRERESGRVGRALDDYIEAQVHGEISLARDVEALVVDPSFRGTDVGRRLAGIAGRHGLALRYHPGFVLSVDAVDAEFRGPDIPPLAARVHAEFARPGEPLHAALVGRAAASVVREPQRWADRGPAEVTLQHLKQLWHVLVRFGAPA